MSAGAGPAGAGAARERDPPGCSRRVRERGRGLRASPPRLPGRGDRVDRRAARIRARQGRARPRCRHRQAHARARSFRRPRDRGRADRRDARAAFRGAPRRRRLRRHGRVDPSPGRQRRRDHLRTGLPLVPGRAALREIHRVLRPGGGWRSSGTFATSPTRCRHGSSRSSPHTATPCAHTGTSTWPGSRRSAANSSARSKPAPGPTSNGFRAPTSSTAFPRRVTSPFSTPTPAPRCSARSWRPLKGFPSRLPSRTRPRCTCLIDCKTVSLEE